ncbi:MAG: carboxypeptidase M32 [Oscillospiraceae bacterium]|nr:carboxypeptidase M32 [Oscillospiraceae bacterium]
MTNQEKIARLYELLSEIEAYGRAMGKLNFDLECCAPEEGMEQAGEDMAILGKHLHALNHAPEFTDLVCQLHADGAGLTAVQRRMVEKLYLFYQKTKNQTPEFSYEMDKAYNRAYGDWLRAKKAGDFGLYRDTFAEVIDFARRDIALREEQFDTPYDASLDDAERGMLSADLDPFFAALKARILPLTARIVAEGKPIREDFMTRSVPIPVQEELSRYLLEAEGLRSTALVLMTTEHPFTTNFGPKDVRVTTHYYENSFISNVFTTLHEGGHALFMQNEPEELYANHCANYMSNGMHECISRFYENLIGRSEAFIHFIYPKLQALSGGVFADVSERELYEAVNVARPSLIRTEADELTYCIHILIRYEIEKAFVNGEITVDEIPALWNAKYKAYLGLDVPSDTVGCLQDVHWTGGWGFGYFPSYALGNAYGAQIMRVLRREMDVDAVIRAGELWRVRDWLKERVFSCASLLDPKQWLVQVTGESLNVNYYLDYLEEKFTALYDLH